MYCPSKYHKGCVSIPDFTTPPKDWACPECMKKKKKGESGAYKNPEKGNCGEQNISPQTSEALAQTVPSSVDSDVCTLRQELAQYMAEQREFREELRASIASMGARMDGFERRLEVLEQKGVPAGKDEVSDLQQKIAQLQSDLNERDQEVLLTDLDIGQIPEEKGENVTHTVTILATKLGVTLQDRDIVFAERVGSVNTGPAADGAGGEGQRSRPRRVVVRLARRELRDELLRAARVRRNINTVDIGLAGPPRRVYVNERLTKTNRLLFYKARTECKKRQWRYSWTKRGRIFVRQAEGQPIHLIRSDSDLVRVFGPSIV